MYLKQLVLALSLSLVSVVASAGKITFMSGVDDGCKHNKQRCVLSDTTARTYVNPDNYAELAGASWVQPTQAWKKAGAKYRVWEMDLNRPSQDMRIDSLFVSFDDDLQIRSKGKLLAEINRYDVPNGNPWAQVINVFDYIKQDIIVAAGGRLNFWVTNSGNGPTGLAYKGTATSVSEPATLALFGLGLLALGIARRRAA